MILVHAQVCSLIAYGFLFTVVSHTYRIQSIGFKEKKKKKEKIKGGTNSKLQQQKKEVISVPLETLDQAGRDYSLKYKCLKSRNVKRF